MARYNKRRATTSPRRRATTPPKRRAATSPTRRRTTPNQRNMTTNRGRAVATKPSKNKGTSTWLFDGVTHGLDQSSHRNNDNRWWDLTYEDAGFTYFAYPDYPPNFIIAARFDITIEGVSSTNPWACTPQCTDYCYADNTGYWPFTFAFDIHHSYIPNYGNSAVRTPTGNADAIAVMYRGKVVGWDYVNNIVAISSESCADEDRSFGIVLPMRYAFGHYYEYLIEWGYPEIGDSYDDLIIYRASTGTHHRLTEESHNYLFKEVGMTVDGGGVIPISHGSLDFGPPISWEGWGPLQGTTITYNLHSGQNLISIPLQLEDSSLSAVFGTNGNINKVIGEGIAGSFINSQWLGSLEEVNPLSGYWINVVNPTTLTITGILSNNMQYNLHIGENLISFPHTESVHRDIALQGWGGIITKVVSEGRAMTWVEDVGWVGSLTHFQRGRGYWVSVTQDTSFQFNLQ